MTMTGTIDGGDAVLLLLFATAYGSLIGYTTHRIMRHPYWVSFSSSNRQRRRQVNSTSSSPSPPSPTTMPLFSEDAARFSVNDDGVTLISATGGDNKDVGNSINSEEIFELIDICEAASASAEEYDDDSDDSGWRLLW